MAVPDYDPAAIAKGMLAEFDQNQDGQLSGAEVQSLAMLMRDDANQDGALSGEELKAIVQKWVDGRAGRCDLTCRVTAGGRPLAGATITYHPLAALEGLVPTGTATTDQNGVGIVACSVDGGPPRSGMPCGFYQVTITPTNGASTIDHDQVFEVSSRDTNIHIIALTSSLAGAR